MLSCWRGRFAFIKFKCRSNQRCGVGPRTIFFMSWIGWALLSAAFAAATALLAKVGVAHVDSNLAMALRTSVVVVFAWAIVFTFAHLQTGPPSGTIAATRAGDPPAATGFVHGVGAELRSLDRRTLLFLAL